MKTAIITLLMLIIGTFYILTIRDGHDWGDDFSMYIHHAKNIAEGVRYDRVGLIQNPSYPSYSLNACPPVFPLLLAPVYRCFGLNLFAMKIEIVVLFIAFLFLFYFIFRRDLPFVPLSAVIALTGFTPYLWDFKDQILSDVPFLVFLFAGLFFINRAGEPDQTPKQHAFLAVAIAVSTYLAYGTRTVGIVLIPCLLILEFLKTRRLSRFAIIASLASLILILAQELVVPSGHSSFYSLASSLHAVIPNAIAYGRTLYLVWSSGYSDAFDRSLFIILCVSALWGYRVRLRTGVTSFEVFVPLYVASFLAWPYLQGRFVIPLIPLIVFYSFVGIRDAAMLKRKAFSRFAVALLVLLLVFSCSAQYARANFGPIPEGVGRESTVQMFDFIINHTDPDDVFICRRPRALSLFTDRTASVYRPGQDKEELWSFVRAIGAKYLVVGPFDSPDIISFIDRYRDNLKEIYNNTEFKIYSISSSD